ncbi:MAG: alanine--tRNA ligase [Phycisphaerales bacterium]|nr:alanine--tRNA ligase [Phycisphaerales bacterium]
MSRTASQIRQQFLDFFVERCGHTIAPSSPVVPHDDPTLLFTNAGMNQFKDVFLGRGTRPYTRAVNTQKCIRAGGKHNDLEDVGRDTYHHTFFEMLGNWSFGDYFKAESIAWGWELLTEVYGIDPTRLYATYFAGDEKAGLAPDNEARDLWLRHLPPERVLPGNMKDNFWEMGETGPCGPCSELHYDRIGGRNAAKLVNADDPDVLEIWNHVFIQFNREAGGVLKPLPARHVDTGMGLERLVSVLQDKRSNYDTDLFTPIFAAIQERTGARPYGGRLDDATDTAYRVIADHIRCLTMALTDGAVPSNEGRGYVLRRILRRAVRHGHQTLGVHGPFLCDLVPAVVASLGEAFPELRIRPAKVADVIREEEASFGRTLDRGLTLFADAAARAAGRGSTTIDAEDAFKLHDTYGFPIDLTQVMASERGLDVDLAGYESLMEQAREASRRGVAEEHAITLTPDAIASLQHMQVNPTGDVDKYHGRPLTADVLAIWNGRDFDDFAEPGRKVAVILNRTNHYAEAGGQVGDRGYLHTEFAAGEAPHRGMSGRLERGGCRFEIEDTQFVGGYVLHLGHVVDSKLQVGDRCTVFVDRDRRDALRANHTATHLLNLALRTVIGEEVDQKGSLVAPDRLRFDFSCSHAPAVEQMEEVERLVNERIDEALPVHAEIVPLNKAKAIAGVRAVFGERYPDPVRVVAIGAAVGEMLADPTNARWLGVSTEFCGGTHLSSTDEAKRFVLVSEGALAAGVRRVFGLTGAAAMAAEQAAKDLAARVREIGALSDEAFPAAFDEVAPQADALTLSLPARRRIHAQLEALRERAKSLRKARQSATRDTVVEEARAIAEMTQGRLIVHPIGSADRDVIMSAMDAIRARRPETAIMLLGADVAEQKVTIVASVPKSLVAAGLRAGDWVKEAAAACGGSGGGKPEMAQAGGKSPEHLPEAMSRAMSFAESKLAHAPA